MQNMPATVKISTTTTKQLS